MYNNCFLEPFATIVCNIDTVCFKFNSTSTLKKKFILKRKLFEYDEWIILFK